MNIIQNAVEQTMEGGTINIYIEEKNENLTFTVEDTGNGFTKEALMHGAEQFLWIIQAEAAKRIMVLDFLQKQ